MNQYSPTGFSFLPLVVKNLLIINGIMFLADIVLARFGIDLSGILGLHFFMASDFHPYQLLTYMFMHGNFAHLFFYYGGSEQPLRDPYPFVSYLYYRVDAAKYGADATDIFDSIVIPLLSNIGDVSLENEPDYVPEKDPRILFAVEAWRKADMTG